MKANMSKKIRLIIFIFLAATYFIAAPILIYYAIGYRINFDNRTIFSTGGFYLKFWPQEVKISIDQNSPAQTGIFSNEELIQGLSPKKYNILVEKEGYFSWDKSLDIEEKKITKIENVTLIKKDLTFSLAIDNISNIFLSPDSDLLLGINLPNYTFSIFDSQNKRVKNTFTIPGVTANDAKNIFVALWDQNIKTIYIGIKDNPTQYFSVEYSKAGALTPKPFKFNNDIEGVSSLNGSTFKETDNNILLQNAETKEFEPIFDGKGIAFSNDKSKVLFFNNHEVLYANASGLEEKFPLLEFPGTIADCEWLNNNYIICSVSNEIKIFEIDFRDKINTVTLKINLLSEDNTSLTLKNPKIIFDTKNKYLYVLNEKTLFVSDPLTDKSNR